MSSEETSSTNVSASAVRMPFRSSGSALGTTTSQSTRRRLAPRLLADQTSACSHERAPLYDATVTGIMQPRKMSKIFDPSPKPSHSTVIGMSADLGSGYSASTSGATNASTVRHHAMAMPSAAPSTMASASPAAPR